MMPAAGHALARPAFDREAAADLAARLAVGTLFTLLTINLFGEFIRTGHVTGLLLLASELLIVVLTIVRRRATSIDRSAATRLVTLLSLVGPPLLRAGEAAPLAPDAATAIVSSAGLMIVIVAKLTLGRSFGIVPALRGIVVRGPYTVVRHPIYAGYLLSHLAFVTAHPTPWNVAVVLVADGALVVRALLEERMLYTDDRYQAYCRQVAWHLVPGVF
jgi:protein-S-isoprenylcysteine O-methyltransferase Ste14